MVMKYHTYEAFQKTLILKLYIIKGEPKY